jgi:hypothetical protein
MTCPCFVVDKLLKYGPFYMIEDHRTDNKPTSFPHPTHFEHFYQTYYKKLLIIG